MKKLTIKITKTQNEEGEAFAFYGEFDAFLFSVSCKDKKIKGKDLFEKIYAKASVDDPINVEVDQSELCSDDQKRFGEYVKDLFDAINDAMNKQFLTEGSGGDDTTPKE